MLTTSAILTVKRWVEKVDLGVWGEKVAEELPQQDHLPLGIPTQRCGCTKGQYPREQPWLGGGDEIRKAQSLLDIGAGALGTRGINRPVSLRPQT